MGTEVGMCEDVKEAGWLGCAGQGGCGVRRGWAGPGAPWQTCQEGAARGLSARVDTTRPELQKALSGCRGIPGAGGGGKGRF